MNRRFVVYAPRGSLFYNGNGTWTHYLEDAFFFGTFDHAMAARAVRHDMPCIILEIIDHG